MSQVVIHPDLRNELKSLNKSAFKASFNEGRTQPTHVVYGGAQLFKTGTINKIGTLAVAHFEQYTAQISRCQQELDPNQSVAVWQQAVGRAKSMLQHRSVQDFRIDFEDGFGVRSHAEEDQCARTSAEALADELLIGPMKSDIGLRIKALDAATADRAVRTLEIFCASLFAKWTPNETQSLILTLPKVESWQQAETIARICSVVENLHKLPPNFFRLELMIESLGVFSTRDGANDARRMIDSTHQRLQAFHIGSYDLTAQCGVAALDQGMRHPACDWVILNLKAATEGTDIWISDGATATLPLVPHRGEANQLTSVQRAENESAVYYAWRKSLVDIRGSLRLGVSQGWDLHPHQIAIRYLTLAHYYSVNLPEMHQRMENFTKKKEQATAVGTAFDDAATVRGLVNFFSRGLAIGALQESECAGFSRW
jgi:citrate lyase beta subunit